MKHQGTFEEWAGAYWAGMEEKYVPVTEAMDDYVEAYDKEGLSMKGFKRALQQWAAIQPANLRCELADDPDTGCQCVLMTRKEPPAPISDKLLDDMMQSFAPARQGDSDVEFVTTDDLVCMMEDTLEVDRFRLACLLKERGFRTLLQGDRWKWMVRRVADTTD